MLQSMIAALAIIVGYADFSVVTCKVHRQACLKRMFELFWLPQQVLWQLTLKEIPSGTSARP